MIITTVAFPFVSSFHRPRLRPCPRRAVFLLVRSASSPSSSWEEREETRWLREEQRWLREEQRWLREESRWRAEREALLSEITALHLRLRALEPLADATAPVPPPKPKPKPAESVAPPPPPVPAARVASPPPPKPAARVPPPPPPVPATAKVVEVTKEVIVEEKAKPKAGSSGGKRRALRVGSEGEEVRLMQEALEKLGFYSGEEDTEFSSFSTGTERAVKTWQASIGTTEDGLMTSELLERLFTGHIGEDIEKVGINGALVQAVTEAAEVPQTVVKEDFNKHRVYLLGENRWEDPSRLTNRNKPISGATTASTKQCITCRGEGHLLCLECDGTGEPNIEPQFLEWIGEDTKCAYCEGLGYTICDACEGNKTVKS
ncbi:protein disulfide isomerase pTAC5, chloroplastic-like [Lolium rigidum]|uniref:protein disulfide isomerase pTAC5, chloroplastic-like n=1 Tax=Lolium rigidum TaxID=89674 RepID=UPI001F5E18BE|nr:protein disulfide isomerase pTAC5, chloroplastic-like [Lolium rigidum]